MKVIFLDFDGVISTQRMRYHLDEEKMLLVKEICDKTGAKIVITSSWRRHTLEDTIRHITSKEEEKGRIPFLMPELIVGITERIYAFPYTNKEKHYRVPRGVEIDIYLKNNRDIENYVILDDDNDMLVEQLPHFIQTHPIKGILKEDVEKAIRLLTQKIEVDKIKFSGEFPKTEWYKEFYENKSLGEIIEIKD